MSSVRDSTSASGSLDSCPSAACSARRGDPQLEARLAATGAGGDGRLVDDPAVAVDDPEHALGDVVDLLGRRAQLDGRGLLDLAADGGRRRGGAIGRGGAGGRVGVRRGRLGRRRRRLARGGVERRGGGSAAGGSAHLLVAASIQRVERHQQCQHRRQRDAREGGDERDATRSARLLGLRRGGESARDACVERGGERRARARRLGDQQRRQLGQLRILGRDRAGGVAGERRVDRRELARARGSSCSRRRMAGLPQLGHRAVQERAGVRLADADQLRDLGVGEAGVELQRDQLALARVERLQRGADGRAGKRGVGRVVGDVAALVDRVGGERRMASAPAQLVERGVARDPEQPGALVAAPAVERAPTAVRALEREGGDVLGRRRVAQQRRDVRVHVVATRAVERFEALPGCVHGRRRGGHGGVHTGTTRRQNDPSQIFRPEQPRVVRDHAGHAHRDQLRDLLGVVDRPDVQLAAGARDLVDQLRRHQPPVDHQRVAPSRAQRLDGASRQRLAHRQHRGVGRQLQQRRGRVVAFGAWDRPAEPQPRLVGADARERLRVGGGDQRPRDEPVGAQRVDDAQLVAGDLQVDVELDPVEGGAGEVGEAVAEAEHVGAGGVLVVVREQQPAAGGVRPAVGAEPGQHVELDHLDAGLARASKLASVLPGAIRSAPLWPTRLVLSADIRGTSRSCGCRRPGRAP